MSKFNDMIQDFHESSKKWDPATHYGLDLAQKSSTSLVGETSHAIGDLGGGSFIGDAGRHWDQMADKDSQDFGRWGGNNLKGIASYFGASAGYGAMGGYAGLGGAGGASADSGSVPYEYIDSSSYVSGADPFSYGSGVDPNYGTVDFGSQNFDNPGNTIGKQAPQQSWWQKAAGGLGKQGGQGAGGGLMGGGGYTQPNPYVSAPIYDNDADQARLRQLVAALKRAEDEDGGYA